MYSIKQYYYWKHKDIPEDSTLIVKYSHYWQAWLYRFFCYDLIAEPAWKLSFDWRIEYSND